MIWHVNTGRETVQLSWKTLHDGVADGTIAMDALMWTEGMPDWRPVAALFGSGSPPTALPSAPPRRSLALRAVAALLIAAGSGALFVWSSSAADGFDAALGSHATAGLFATSWVAVWAVLAAAGWIAAVALWRHPSRRAGRMAAGLCFLLALVLAIAETVVLAQAVLISPDLYRIQAERAATGDATIVRDGGTLRIEGQIGPHLLRDVEASAAAIPIDTVEIESPGGLLDQALDLARYLESNRTKVVVTGHCLSACTVIAVASPDSYAHEDVVFGFHRSSPIIDLKTEVMTRASQYTDKEATDFLKAHGVPDAVLAEAQKHGPETVHEVTASQMVDFGAIKGLLSGDKVLKTGPKRQ